MVSEQQGWLRFEFFPAGTELIEQGGQTGALIVLKEGEVEIERDGRYVSAIKQPGAIFGEMSILLERPHTASVRALTDVQVFVIDDALRVLEQHPAWLMQIARLLAQRVNATTALLVAARAPSDEPEVMVLPSNVFASWSDPQM